MHQRSIVVSCMDVWTIVIVNIFNISIVERKKVYSLSLDYNAKTRIDLNYCYYDSLCKKIMSAMYDCGLY